MSLTASEVASLTASLDCWEKVEYIAEFMVFAGCAGEVIADFIPRVPATWKKPLEKYSAIVLVVALLVLLIALTRTNELFGTIMGSIGDVAGNAAKNATDALTDSGTALTQSGDAKDSAAGAKTIADTAKGSAETALEKADLLRRTVNAVSAHADAVDSRVGQTQLLVSSRSILNLADFKEAVKSLAGKTIFVRSYSGDIDSYFLCTAIVSTLRPEVTAQDECGKVPPFTPPITNIAVFGPTDEEMTGLDKVFFRAGIQGGLTSGPYGNMEHSPVDVVFVGARPPFSMVQGPIRQPPNSKLPSKQKQHKQHK